MNERKKILSLHSPDVERKVMSFFQIFEIFVVLLLDSGACFEDVVQHAVEELMRERTEKHSLTLLKLRVLKIWQLKSERDLVNRNEWDLR
jgi:hypothetical protein